MVLHMRIIKRKKKKHPEYVVICREYNKYKEQIEITVIDSNVTEHLLNNLVRIHLKDPNKQYFLTLKKDYQLYGALFKKQIEAMSITKNKRIMELGIDVNL